MMEPTLFGFNGSSLIAGGEAGPEAILPLKGFYTKLEAMLDSKLNMSGIIVDDTRGLAVYCLICRVGRLSGKLAGSLDLYTAGIAWIAGKRNILNLRIFTASRIVSALTAILTICPSMIPRITAARVPRRFRQPAPALPVH